jgi:predicted amidohydrolase YtcJ
VTTNPSSYIWRSGLDMLAHGVAEDDLAAHQALLDEGIPWALATDNKPYWLLWVLWTTLARTERREGRVIGPGQRIARADALRALTWSGAYCCFEERRRGSLEPGKLADLVVLSDDPLTVPVDAIRELRVELTMVGGRVVHSAGPDLPPAEDRPREG